MRIALVTGAAYVEEAARADAPLVHALEARGAEVVRPVWHDDEVDWSGFDLAFVRSTWDYFSQRERFVAWAERVGALTSLWNPPDVLRWNTHKSYLIELEERGTPIVPTAWLGRGDRVDLAHLLDRRDWADAVVKPAVGGGAEGLLRVLVDTPDEVSDHRPGPAAVDLTPGAPADLATGQRHLDQLLVAGDVLVQPYLERIETKGELSVFLVEGRLSHAVRKVPAPGDLRVHEHLGGHYAEEDVDAEVAGLAEWVVEATGAELLVARVDLVEDTSGALQLVELEATEPDLYLGVVPEAADLVADAVLARVS